MNNLKSAEEAKKAILERIAAKLSEGTKNHVGANHSAHGSCHSSHGNRVH